MKTWTVYMHKTPNNKVYIGITCRETKKRWGKNGIYYKCQPYFYNAILKYGWENIEHTILYQNLSKEEAKEKEVELISQYDSTNRDKGYNLSIGGEGHSGYSPTKETRQKMSDSHKGDRSYWFGKYGRLNPCSRPVLQFTLNGEFVKEWESVRCVQRELGFNRGNLTQCCRGNKKTVGGFIWKYKE